MKYLTCTNYGFIIYTQVRMTKLHVHVQITSTLLVLYSQDDNITRDAPVHVEVLTYKLILQVGLPYE